VGQVVDPPDPADDIVVTGIVDEDVKWGLLRGARALVAPSPHEAFSITVVEAMTAGSPVIVNAKCGATREHAEQSGAGLWFGDFGEFEAVVDRLTTDDALHDTMVRNGARYVESNYRWPVILDRYCGFLESFARENGVP
jgi:glycosyltransferase involved in cell wall biosynthesis